MKQQLALKTALVILLAVTASASEQDVDQTSLETCSNTSDCSATLPKGQSALLQSSKTVRARPPIQPPIDMSLINASAGPSGAAAPLTQEGYAAVADCCCQAEMEQFITRVVFDLGLEVCNKAGLDGLAPYHTCEKGPQTYDALTTNLMDEISNRCSAFARAGECAAIPADCPLFPEAAVPDCHCSGSKAAKLNFARAFLGQNNLGGVGPDTGVEEMRYINIFAKPFPIRWTAHPDICIDVAGGEYKNGANVATWDCTAGGSIESGTHFNMQWTLPPSGTGVIRWTPHPDKCFQVAGGSTANGANLELWDCDDTDPNQQFTIPASGSGVIKWATNPTKCIDVKDGKTGNRVNIQMVDCDETDTNMLWTVPQVSDATDLVVTSTSTLTSPSNNDVQADMNLGFGSLKVSYATSTDFNFKFVQSGTSKPRVLDEFHMAFFDIDKAGDGAEFIQGSGYKGYITDTDTSLSTSTLPSGRTKFVGTETVDDPTAPGTASSAQRKASVMFFFKDVSEFGATFGQEGGTSSGTSKLLFSGSSVLVDRCAA